ncbi:hypothetical protein [Paludibacterium purpuratum]|uniref:Uncharacterized protein n=1 Tax=Paludibacterium purpuratum TaxID=1144873 RepID=A0A4R7AWZ1_9NEIS|nr:hypothetical protein [Paludibacterium purpuratum]TDR70644.1 hypothetical protein DFP86_12246 [Paludibacterium purpuratum]
MAIAQVIQAAKIVEVSCPVGTPSWLPIVSAALGALVGGLASFGGVVGSEWIRSKNKSKSVLAAIRAEIVAMLGIIELRQYVAQAKNILSELQRMPPGARATYQVRIDGGYNKVFVANLENLGLLQPAAATKILEFYQLIQSVVSDVTPGGLLAEGQGGVQAFAEMIAIIEQAIAIGREIAMGDWQHVER